MCGIVGWAGAPGVDGEDALRRMCELVRHRGPDDDGAFVVPGEVALGFRRLAVIDLTTGAQPLANEDGTVVVVCNGEIYNFRELRDSLRARGHSFRSGSDAEVIVHLYEEAGPALVEQLQGMFAFAVWDGKRRRLLLARDRLGVKPLYWAEKENGLLFASEPGAILASGAVDPEPDLFALGQYLTLQYVPSPRTGFTGVSKLGAGEFLIHEGNRVEVRQYWQPPEHGAEVELDTEAALDRTDALLRDATRARLVSDVPLGAFLSGGIDSTLVVGYMAEALPQVATFSIDFPSAAYSEAEHARAVSERYSTNHHELTVEASMVPLVAHAATAVGEPFADSSAIPTYVLSELTRRHVTVALSGDGGDEAFGGYWRYRRALAADRLAAYRPVARLALSPLARPLVGRMPARVQDGIAAVATAAAPRYSALLSHFDPKAVEQLALDPGDGLVRGSRDAWETTLALPERATLESYLGLDARTYLPDCLMTKVDRMSMAHALEVRSPFLDYRVYELAATLPADLKIRGRTTKWLLRELARRRGAPASIIDRPKKGFSIPIGVWLRTSLRPWVEDLLGSPDARVRTYLRSEAVDAVLDEHLSGVRDHSSRLWNLAMLELWQRRWIDGGG